MAAQQKTKPEYLYQSGMTTYKWLDYPRRVVLQGEGGFLSTWEAVEDPNTYDGYGIMLGGYTYRNVEPYVADVPHTEETCGSRE